MASASRQFASTQDLVRISDRTDFAELLKEERHGGTRADTLGSNFGKWQLSHKHTTNHERFQSRLIPWLLLFSPSYFNACSPLTCPINLKASPEPTGRSHGQLFAKQLQPLTTKTISFAGS